MPTSAVYPLPSFTTFGELLHYLRRRARLTQRELSIAVGYSESMISRLEHNERPPDVATLLAIFVPALHVAGEPEVVARLTVLAQAARGEVSAESKPLETPVVGSVPPSQSATIRLPQRLTSFIGRSGEVASVINLLAQARLVTLTGPGGCGKTSLAIEIARAMANGAHFNNGIYLVELVPLTDPALIAQSILLALGVEGNRERPALETLLSFLGNKSALLVLDNCEHLIDAAAHVSETLLRTCSNLRILVTSRERLNIPGETLFSVSSLAFPDPQVLPDLAALSHFAAIQLFVERSQTVAPNFHLTAQNAAAVAQICARLDGIPLALELTAAALLTFSVHEIAKRLDTHFLLSTPGYRTADARHQSLNDTVAWSYNLLSLAEQRLLARLAVFVGGWRAEALQAICPDEADPLALLRQLVQKSLVRVEQGESSAENHTRYHLLRSIREYATERLSEQGNAETIRQRHFAYFARLAEEMGGQVLGERHQSAMAALDADYYNIRTAFFYADGKVDLADARLRLVAALIYYWHLRGHAGEGISWLQAAMVDESQISLSTRALAYAALLTLYNGNFFYWSINVGDLDESRRLVAIAEKLIEPCLIQGETLAAAQLMLTLGNVYHYHGNNGSLLKAKEYGQTAKRIFDSLAHQRGIGFSRNLLIWVTIAQGDIQTAETMLEEHMRFLQQRGMTWGLGEAYTMLVRLANLKNDRNGEIYHLKQLVALAEQEENTSLVHEGYYKLEHLDALSAIEMAEAFLDRQRQKGISTTIGFALHQLGRMYLNAQQFERAQRLLDEEMALWRGLDDGRGEVFGLQWCLIDRGQVARFLGDLNLAIDCFDESIARFATSPFPVGVVYPLLYSGHVRLIKRELSGALDNFRQCIDEITKVPKVLPKAWNKHTFKALAGIGEVARQRGHLALAAKLFAASSIDPKSEATHSLFSEVADHNRIMAAMPTYLQDPVFAAAWQEGEKLSLDEAIALALAG